MHDINNRSRVYSARCACLLDMYKNINKVHLFQLLPRPISIVKEGDDLVVVKYEEEKLIGEWPGCRAVSSKAIGHKHSTRL